MSSFTQRILRWLPLGLIVIAGGAIRFYQVGTLPPGLYRDEAFYGLDALSVLRGHLAVYFAANNGREGLFMYLLALGIALFGRTPEALRIVSAAIGALTIGAIYMAGRNLFSHRIGVLSAAVLSITFWHVALSRVAFRAITLPLLLCLTIGFGAALLRCWREPSSDLAKSRGRLILLSVGAGVSFGLTFYTYTSAQFLLALIIAFLIGWNLFHIAKIPGYEWSRTNAMRSAIVIVVCAAALVLAPEALWLIRHPDMVFARAEQVSILSPVINKGDLPGILWMDIVKAAGMFAYQGDRIWRHNLSQRPVFEGVLAILFFAGVGVSVWRMFRGKVDIRPASLFILLWLAVFLIPTILAEDTPHYLRAIGALPAACMLAALGCEAVLAWLSRRGFLSVNSGLFQRVIHPPALLAAVILVVSGYSTVNAYFTDYASNDMAAYWLENNNLQLANVINSYVQTNKPESIWLQDRLANDNPALRFLSPAVENGLVSIVGDNKLAPATPPGLLLVDPNHDWTILRNALPAKSQIRISEGPLAQNDLETQPRRAFIAVYVSPTEGQKMGDITFAQSIHLNAAGLQLNGQQVLYTSSQLPSVPAVTEAPPSQQQVYTVTLSWSTTLPVTADYAVFVHQWRNGIVVAQHDGTPGLGYLPMPTWRPGDVIMDTYVLTAPGGLRPGDSVDVGIYRRSDNMRLPVGNSVASKDEPDAVMILDVSDH